MNENNDEMVIDENSNQDTREKEVTVDEALKETTVNEEMKETTVNEEAKETTFNENAKETTFNEHPAENRVPENSDEQDNLDDEKQGDIENLEDDRINPPDEEEKGPFEDGDIIAYMYKNWLIAGMNYAWVSGAKWIKAESYKRKYQKNRRKAEKNKNKEVSRYDTYKMRYTYEKKALDEITKKENQLVGNRGLINLAEKVREGKYEEAGLSPEMQDVVKNMPKKQFDEMFAEKNVKKYQKNINDTLISANQFAHMYAQLSMLETKAKDANDPMFQNGNDPAYQAQVKKGLILYAKAMGREAEQGGDTRKFSGKLLDQAKNALDVTRKNIEKGNFNGYHKKRRFRKDIIGERKENKEFDKLLKTLSGIDTNEPAANMFEAIIRSQAFDKEKAAQLVENQNQERILAARRQRNDDRRRRLQEAKDRMDPTRRAQREAKNAEREAKRQKRIKNLENPDYVMTDSKGNKNQEATNKWRQFYRDRGMMR